LDNYQIIPTFADHNDTLFIYQLIIIYEESINPHADDVCDSGGIGADKESIGPGRLVFHIPGRDSRPLRTVLSQRP
jgi:hypothetical protein